MQAENLFVLLVKTLAEKSREILAWRGTRANFEARRAEIALARHLISEATKTLDTIEFKLAQEWQKTSGKRLVWSLWRKQRL